MLKRTTRIDSHRDLLVWQKAMDLVDAVYDLVEEFPAKETYGLSSQLTRAVASVPANIAEGRARSTARDFANFITIARSSLMEVETLLTIAVRRGYVTPAAAERALSGIVEVSKMLSSLRSSILRPSRKSHE